MVIFHSFLYVYQRVKPPTRQCQESFCQWIDIFSGHVRVATRLAPSFWFMLPRKKKCPKRIRWTSMKRWNVVQGTSFAHGTIQEIDPATTLAAGVAAGRNIELGLVEGKTCRTAPPGLMGTPMAYSPFISMASDVFRAKERDFLHVFMQLLENRLYFCWFWVIFQPARAYWGHQRLAMFAAMFKQKPRSKSGWWWLEPWNFMTFHSVGNFIIPTDELIFFRGVGWNHQPEIQSVFFICVEWGQLPCPMKILRWSNSSRLKMMIKHTSYADELQRRDWQTVW